MLVLNIIVFCLLFVGCITQNHFLNEWVVKIDGDSQLADKLAKEHDFQYVGELFDGVHVFVHNRIAKRSLDKSDEHMLLADHPKVEWVEQQRVQTRVKRDLFNDPDWPNQWYMNRGENLDMNILEAYNRFGATGEGVVVTILDDGIEKNHTDLRDNYDPKASYDFNDSDDDPQPRYEFTDFNRHGTRCAGEVAATANNGKCGIGIAYKAKIGGIRMLDGDVTDLLEARSVSFSNDHIDIYSASWGPTDDGATLEGPGKLTFLAFHKATNEGRRGMGSIFVWASGNGGIHNDNCNADGYASLIYTISISSASERGQSAYYSEMCSSTFATTYSSGTPGERQIVTTDLHDLCTKTHSGTSASAPLAAGIIALALQVNPNLTWRDVQHIVVLSSRKANLQDGDWEVNGAGRLVSHRFGFGLMDAGKLVEYAKIWKRVPEKNICTVEADFEPTFVSESNQTVLYLDVSSCNGSDDKINYLEHVQAFITFSSTNRGQTEMFLQSPNGTNSTLMTERPRDRSTEGFNSWPFMSTHHWGESPQGRWKLVVACKRCSGTLTNFTLVLHGTASDPTSNSESPRTLQDDERMCAEDEFYLRDSCYKNCPTYYFPSRGMVNVTSQPDDGNEILNVSMCLPCHYTCSYCSGPERFNCTACPGDLSLSDNQCLDSKQGNAYRDIYVLGAIFVAVTFASIVISIAIAGLLTRRRNRNISLSEQRDPLLGDG